MKPQSPVFNRSKAAMVILPFVLAIMASCSSYEPHSETKTYDASAPMSVTDLAPVHDSMITSPSPAPIPVKKMIQDGTINYRVSDEKEFSLHLKQAVGHTGAVFVEDNKSVNDRGIYRHFMIRVRPEKFDSLLNEISAGPGEIIRQDIRAADVTMDYLDMLAELETQKKLRDAFEKEEATSKGDDLTDAMHRTSKARTDIENLEKQIRELTEKTTWSTLRVDVVQPGAEAHFGSDISQGFRTGWLGLAKVITGLAYIWPLLLILSGTLFAIFRINKRKAVAPATR